MVKLKNIFLLCMALTIASCAANVETTSKTSTSLQHDKIIGLNVLYIDSLHKGNVSTVGASVHSASAYANDARKKFSDGVLNQITQQLQPYQIEAIARGYNLKKDQKIDAKLVESLFTESKAYPLLVISPVQMAITCTNYCGHEMEVKSELVDFNFDKPLWQSHSNIGKDLLGKSALISTQESSKKFVRILIEKMKADGIF